MTEKKPISGKYVVISGIFLAITMVLLYGASIFPVSKLTIMAVCGAVLYLLVIYGGMAPSILMFIAALVLSFILLPNKFVMLPYAFCFGPFVLLKKPLEKVCGISRQENHTGRLFIKINARTLIGWFIKLLCSAALIFAGYMAFSSAFLANFSVPDRFPLWLIAAAASVMIIVYDYMLSLVGIIAKGRIGRLKI